MDMKPLRTVLLTLAAALLLTAAVWAADYNGYIVCTKRSAPVKGAALMAAQPEDALYLVDTLEEAEKLAAHTEVEYICPNYYMELQGAPDDPYYEKQWTLPAINWLPAYEQGLRGSGVTVAVIDSGIEKEFEDFSGVHLSAYSKNFVSGYADDDLSDKVSHGTFVASQIAATTGNGLGIAGIADSVDLMILRCFVTNTVDTFSIVPVIEYAVDKGADIINLSFGDTDAVNPPLENAIRYALDRGVIVVAAAGNYGDKHNLPMYPASYDGVISVASVAKSDSSYIHADSSEHNDMVDIAAPGSSVYGIRITSSPKYNLWSGTSFSTPVVSAVAALMKGKDPDMTADSFYGLLAANALDLGVPGKDPYYGFGLVDIEAMLNDMESGHYPYYRTTVPATCTEAGVITYHSAKDPSFLLTVPIPPLGHDTASGEFLGSTPPTCTEPGYHLIRCTRCSEPQKVTFAPALGHMPTLLEKDGALHYACQRCKEDYASFDLQDLSQSVVKFGPLADFRMFLAAFDGTQFCGTRCLTADAVLDLSAWSGYTVRALLLGEDLSPFSEAIEVYTP